MQADFAREDCVQTQPAPDVISGSVPEYVREFLSPCEAISQSSLDNLGEVGREIVASECSTFLSLVYFLRQATIPL